MSNTKRKNIIIYFNINYICDNRCRFCFSYHIDNSKDTNIKIEDFAKILDKHKDDHIIRVIINGGEPFLNPDVIRMISEVKKRKLECVLYSNANALRNRDIVEQLTQAMPNRITIPIHGSKNNHCYITRNMNSYDYVMSGLDLLGKKITSSIVELKFIINEGMVRENYDIKNFLMGFPFVENIVICGQVNTHVAKDNGYINQYNQDYYSYIERQLRSLIGCYNIKVYDLHFCKLPVMLNVLEYTSVIQNTEIYNDFYFYDNEHLGDYKLFFTKHGMDDPNCSSCKLQHYCHSILKNYSVLSIDKEQKLIMTYE